MSHFGNRRYQFRLTPTPQSRKIAPSRNQKRKNLLPEATETTIKPYVILRTASTINMIMNFPSSLLAVACETA